MARVRVWLGVAAREEKRCDGEREKWCEGREKWEMKGNKKKKKKKKRV